MIKLSEILIKKPVPNNLKQLLQLQQQIKSTNDIAVKKQLALRCAELVLPIWEYYYPQDKRVRQTIEDAKKSIYNNGAYAAVTAAAAAADDAATAAVYAAAAAAAATAAAAAMAAIKATKLHFKLDEIKVNKPITFPYKIFG